MSRPWLSRNLAALSLVSLLTDASSEMIYPLLPAFLATTLGATAMTVGLVEGSAQALTALVAVLSGRWSDTVQRRKPLVVLGYGLASVLRPLVGVATGVTQVLGIRLGDRLGKGIRGAPRDALIADSVPAAARGRAFGFHRAADHAGAVVGSLAAAGLLHIVGVPLREVFLWSAVPAGLALLVLVLGVQEVRRPAGPPAVPRRDAGRGIPGGPLAGYLAVLLLFTLGNSTDAFLLLRASQAGVSMGTLPLLWGMLHVVKSATATPGGVLSDRWGRRPVIVAGWLVYALVYLGFGQASEPWHVWGLMLAYGLFYGLTEGAEKAYVADLVSAEVRGRAFGLYHLVLGIAALPASLLFGLAWDRLGAAVAFAAGAGMALLAALLLLILPSRARSVA